MCDEQEDKEWDSGPYCRHWGDPCDCEDLCVCGHQCHEHSYHGDECEVDGCKCEEFEDAPLKKEKEKRNG